MPNDSVINLKDLRRKTQVPSHEVPQSATVVLRPVQRSVPEAAPIVQTPEPVPQVAPIPEAKETKPLVTTELAASKSRTWGLFKISALAVSGLLLLGGLGAGGAYVYKHVWTVSPFEPTPPRPAESTQSAAAAATEATPPSSASTTPAMSQAEIISRVSKLMLLPQGEEPVLAAVSDTNALSDQAFFKNAKVGDVVLMYGKARRAILYDPANDKVIEVAPITDTPQ